MTQILMPNLGAAADEAVLVQWLVNVGDEVAPGTPLFEVESDKSTVVVEALDAGRVARRLYRDGDVVPIGTPVAELESSADRARPPEAAADNTLDAPGSDSRNAMEPSGTLAPPDPHDWERAVDEAWAAADASRSNGAAHGIAVGSPARLRNRDVSPRARRVARRLDVDLGSVRGSGPSRRILESDVLAAAEIARAARVGSPAPTAAPGSAVASGRGPVTPGAHSAPAPQAHGLAAASSAAISEAADPLAALRGHRAIVARRMTESARSTAPVTLIREVDGAPLAAARLSLRAWHPELADAISLDLLVAVLIARALAEHPGVNASLTPEGIVVHDEANVGIAIDGKAGLIVPVLHDVGRRTMADLATEWRELRQRALANATRPGDLSGGTFTITNLGHLEIDAFTPIINPGEAAILGLGRIVDRPIVRDGRVAVGRTLFLSLTFDHRVVDGAPAARFLATLAELIEHPHARPAG